MGPASYIGSPLACCPLPRPAPLFLLGALLMLLLPSVLPAEESAGRLPPEPLRRSEVMAAVAFAVEQYNERSPSAYYYKDLRIVEAQPQVQFKMLLVIYEPFAAQGLNFYLTLELVNTLCEKKSGGTMAWKELQNCAVPPEDQQQKRAVKQLRPKRDV
ncbi:cystatin-like [Liasis olivaceus]